MLVPKQLNAFIVSLSKRNLTQAVRWFFRINLRLSYNIVQHYYTVTSARKQLNSNVSTNTG